MEIDAPERVRGRAQLARSDTRSASGSGATMRLGETIERSTIWLFVLSLAWVPFRYGSNDLLAWGINAVLFPGLAALYEISLLIRRVDHPAGLRGLARPAALFAVVVFWIWFQTLTWTPAAPANPIWGMAARALGLQLKGSITVNRDLTNLALVRLITAGSVFWLALQLGRNGTRARLLLKAIGAIGCVYAAYGLLAFAFEALRLPWLEIPPNGGPLSSTFVNHNNFATYAGLGLIAIVGLILRLYRHELAGMEAGWRLQAASLIDITGNKAAAPLAGAFVILVALLLTGSRGGVVATGLGVLVLGLLTRQRAGSARRALFVLVPMLLLAGAALFAFGDIFVGSMEQRGVFDSDRLSVYLLTIRSILDTPLSGHGYGTFIDVFPLYRDRSISVQGVWGQAHDTYLEVFQGLGLVFGAMLVASVLLLVIRCLRVAVGHQEHVTVPRVAVSAAVLVGTHALVDFSLQIQAVTLTLMALIGAGVAQSENPRLAPDRRTERGPATQAG